MTHKTADIRISVTNAQGQKALVIGVPDPTVTKGVDADPSLIYGIGGLVVDKISAREYRDFQGTVWTAER